jgi:hypothetical protein
MGPQPMGKVPDLRRLAGRVASRSTVRWSWPWTFLGFCLLAAVVGGPTVDLPHAQVAAAVAEIPRSAQEPASLPQTITFDQPPDTTVGQQVTLTASSVTTMSPPVGTGLTVSFRSDTPAMCTVSGSIATPTAPGFCVITATQGGDGTYAPPPDVARAFRARAGPEPQTITFDQPAAAAVGQPVALTAASVTMTSPKMQTGLTVSFRSDTPDVCTVSGSTVTPTTADVCTITASQGGSDRYAAAQPVQRSFQAHTGTSQQTITFAQLPDAILGQPVTLSASTDADEPLVVSFRSDSPMVCTVTGSTVTTVAVGTCAITASQGGSATYAAAQASRSFQVTVTTHRFAQQILFGPVPGATVGVPVVLTASSWTLVLEGPNSPTGLAVSYSSQNRRVCTVSGATVVPRTAGRCVITASQDGTAQYLPAEPVTQVFPVARASQIISFTPPASATIDQPVTLTATASSWLPVTYTSSTPDVCTVSGATVAATAAGTCIIIASQPGDGQYSRADPVTGSFPVQKIPQTISFTPPASATVDQPAALTAKASSGLAVTYSPATPGACTVSGTTATATRGGTCTITASQPGDDNYLPATPVTQSFVVQKITQTISFTPPNGAEADQRVALSASATSKLEVSFTSDTPGVCTVSGSTATTIKAGTCAIIASQAGNDRYAAAEPVRKSFPVARIPQTIDFPQPPDVAFGQPVTLTATASSGRPVSYSTSTPDVCTVSGRTVITTAARACAITASRTGDARYAPARDVARSFRVERAAQTINFTPPDGTTIRQPVTLSASASSGLAVSYRTDIPAVCTVSGSTVSPATVGTCTITASEPGNDNYAAAPGVSRSFPVHRGTVHPGKTPQAITFGQPPAAAVGRVAPLSASTTSGLAVSFRSDTPAVCSVSGATVTTTTAGTCAVTASQAGSARYLAAHDVAQSFQVHAGHQAQTITFPLPPEAKAGEAVTLFASATSGLAVAFRSDTPRICTVSGSTLTPTAAGTCTVTASQGGSDHYAAARDVEQSFDVASATSILPGALTILLGAAVFAAAGVTTLVRRVRRRSRRLLGPQPSVRAAPAPGPPALVSVQNTGAGVTHTVRIESNPGASITTIKEARP